jgi:hypothetical protein
MRFTTALSGVDSSTGADRRLVRPVWVSSDQAGHP